MKSSEIILLLIEILLPIILLLLLFFNYIKNNESKLYKKIDLKEKEEYLTMFYLSGCASLKPSLGVISKTIKGYLIENEEKGDSDTFFINYDDITSINIKNIASNNTNRKKAKINKGFEIEMVTKDNKILLLSRKNPKTFFYK